VRAKTARKMLAKLAPGFPLFTSFYMRHNWSVVVQQSAQILLSILSQLHVNMEKGKNGSECMK